MKTTVRIVSEEGGGCRIVRVRDRAALFGGRTFPDAETARRWLIEADRRSASGWREDPGSRPRAVQLRLLF